MPASEDYQHQEQPDPSKHIRLLKILPSSTDTELHCSIEQVLFDENWTITFTALSYVWGEQRHGKLLTLDGSPFHIGHNLWDFLCHIRRWNYDGDHSAKCFWVDAVCIDQNNIAERDAQIRIMGRIFGSADLVLVWLGFLDSQSEKFQALFSRRKYVAADWTSLQQFLNSRDPATALALRNLLRSFYWRRLWIVQEFLLAKRVSLCVGQYTREWSAFYEDMVKHVHLRRKKVSQAFELCHTKRNMCVPNIMLLSFQLLLEIFGNNNCVDPRDKVFALLGLAQNGAHFQGSYADDKLSVFHQALAYLGTECTPPDDVLSKQLSLASVLVAALNLTAKDLLGRTNRSNLPCPPAACIEMVTGPFRHASSWASSTSINVYACQCASSLSWKVIKDCLVYKPQTLSRSLRLLFEPCCLAREKPDGEQILGPPASRHLHACVAEARFASCYTGERIELSRSSQHAIVLHARSEFCELRHDAASGKDLGPGTELANVCINFDLRFIEAVCFPQTGCQDISLNLRHHLGTCT